MNVVRSDHGKGAAMVAGYAGKMSRQARKTAREQAALDAEGARLGRELGMGTCRTTWAGKHHKNRVIFGMSFFILTSPYGAVADIGYFFDPDKRSALVFAVVTSAVLLTLLLMLAWPPRVMRGRLFSYEDGIVQVLNHKPRLTVLRYADLAAISLRVVSGYDGDYVGSCVLRDHAGGELAVRSRLYGTRTCEEIRGAAEDILASRLLDSLTRRLDEGLSVTIGRLTVDNVGITVQRGRRDRGTWTVPWGQVRKVSVTLWGQRLSVNTGKWLDKSVRLDGQPNAFLARYVIAHAARQAGVPVSVG